jgi:hypothetical protein
VNGPFDSLRSDDRMLARLRSMHPALRSADNQVMDLMSWRGTFAGRADPDHRARGGDRAAMAVM